MEKVVHFNEYMNSFGNKWIEYVIEFEVITNWFMYWEKNHISNDLWNFFVRQKLFVTRITSLEVKTIDPNIWFSVILKV